MTALALRPVKGNEDGNGGCPMRAIHKPCDTVSRVVSL
jgi:hypothetical protein